jgi:hypothetical protein
MAQNLVTFLLVLFTAFIVGTGVFLWQETEKENLQDQLTESQDLFGKEKVSLQADLGACGTQLTLAAEEKEALEKQATNLTEQLVRDRASYVDLQKKCCKGAWKDGVCMISTCIDSDVNEKPNDIYIKGSVTYTDQNGIATTVYDECSGTNLQVNELWCYESPKGSGNYVQGRMVYDCPKGCLDGACLK